MLGQNHMKILLVHNHYGSQAPSGENHVFELERDLLRRFGHEVQTLERHSDTLRTRGAVGAIQGAFTTPWGFAAARHIRRQISSFKPDIVHAHNTFPMITPSIFSAAKGAARILTLHNYRLFCPKAIPMRNGRGCTECLDQKSVLPSLRYGCYRDSRAATLPLALNVSLNLWRGTWSRDVERFIALTEFQRETMVRAGLPEHRVAVKPNFYPGKPTRIPFQERPMRVVFAGRLGEEKGAEELVEAWIAWGAEAPELRIVGDGPLLTTLKSRADGNPRIVFVGQVSQNKAESEIAHARLLLVPSKWFEGFPMVLREAFAFGVPIGVSDQGALPSIAAEAGGLVFRSCDAGDLLAKVQHLFSNQDQLSRMAVQSADAFETKFSEAQNYEMLMNIYRQALNDPNTGEN